MKTTQDPRHQKRARTVQDLFSWEFQQSKKPNENIAPIVEKLPTIDEEIEKAAKQWPKDQINRIDLAILRLAIFELIIEKDIPFKVVVDEAVELAKEFGTESSPNFVNGVLGQVITANKINK